jgi:hypothetical protein
MAPRAPAAAAAFAADFAADADFSAAAREVDERTDVLRDEDGVAVVDALRVVRSVMVSWSEMGRRTFQYEPQTAS